MNENYLVWRPVAEFIKSYKLMTESGDIVPDLEAQEISRRRQTALRKFFSDNGLLTVDAFDAKHNLIDREYRKADFTADGMELLRRKEGAWLKSKASAKDPPDTKMLERALAEIRAGK